MPSAPPLRLSLSERLQAAEQLRDQPAQVVAELIGVSPRTVWTYWRAERCPRCAGPKVTAHAMVCGRCVQRPGRQSLSRDTIIAAIQAWAISTGTPPRAGEWMLGQGKWAAEYPRWPALHQVQEVFGSWNAAIRAAGYTPRQVRWTEAAIVHAAQGWTRRHGQPPRIEQWRRTAPDGSHPSMRPVLDAFGTWNAMLLAAGLTVVHRNWSQADVLEALAQWVVAHGRAPTMADWRRPEPPGAFPTAQCAADHFGS